MKSDKKGYYHIATLPTGDYSITVTVDGQIRDRRDYIHISPGRQSATAGNSALGTTFILKPAEVMQAELKKEAAAAPVDDGAAKKREEQERARKRRAVSALCKRIRDSECGRRLCGPARFRATANASATRRRFAVTLICA